MRHQQISAHDQRIAMLRILWREQLKRLVGAREPVGEPARHTVGHRLQVEQQRPEHGRRRFPLVQLETALELRETRLALPKGHARKSLQHESQRAPDRIVVRARDLQRLRTQLVHRVHVPAKKIEQRHVVQRVGTRAWVTEIEADPVGAIGALERTVGKSESPQQERGTGQGDDTRIGAEPETTGRSRLHVEQRHRLVEMLQTQLDSARVCRRYPGHQVGVDLKTAVLLLVGDRQQLDARFHHIGRSPPASGKESRDCAERETAGAVRRQHSTSSWPWRKPPPPRRCSRGSR